MEKTNNKSFPAFQYSAFLGSKDEQLVIRADTWDEFIEYKKQADKIIKKKKAKTSNDSNGTEKSCPQCGADMVFKQGTSDKGKKWKGYFCSNDCGIKPQWI